MKDNLVYLRHIVEAIDKIDSCLAGFDFEKFSLNDLIFDAVIRELEIIGEAANKVEVKFQDSHPEIPWRKMIAIRNLLIHEYFGVNPKIVWETCQTDLKELKAVLKTLLSDK